MRTLIFGAGKLGHQCLRLLRAHCPDRPVMGFVDDSRPAGAPVADGLVTLGGLEDCAARWHADSQLVFAIGYADMAARLRALDRALAAGWRLATLVHPRAWVEPDVQLGEGCIVCAGAIVDKGARLGAGCYVDIGVLVGEDGAIGRANYLSAGANLGGSVRMGDGNFVGMDATIVTDMTVGDRNFINAKTLIHKPVPSDMQVIQVHSVRMMGREAGG